jgi:hypothetical protein
LPFDAGEAKAFVLPAEGDFERASSTPIGLATGAGAGTAAVDFFLPNILNILFLSLSFGLRPARTEGVSLVTERLSSMSLLAVEGGGEREGGGC